MRDDDVKNGRPTDSGRAYSALSSFGVLGVLGRIARSDGKQHCQSAGDKASCRLYYLTSGSLAGNIWHNINLLNFEAFTATKTSTFELLLSGKRL